MLSRILSNIMFRRRPKPIGNEVISFSRPKSNNTVTFIFKLGCVFDQPQVEQPQVYEKFVFTACKNPTVTNQTCFVTVGFLHAVNTNFSYTCG